LEMFAAPVSAMPRQADSRVLGLKIKMSANRCLSEQG
jgi:hypothetical protein